MFHFLLFSFLIYPSISNEGTVQISLLLLVYSLFHPKSSAITSRPVCLENRFCHLFLGADPLSNLGAAKGGVWARVERRRSAVKLNCSVKAAANNDEEYCRLLILCLRDGIVIGFLYCSSFIKWEMSKNSKGTDISAYLFFII